MSPTVPLTIFALACSASLTRYMYGRWYSKSTAISDLDRAMMAVSWINPEKIFLPEQMIDISATNFGLFGKITARNRAERLRRLGMFEYGPVYRETELTASTSMGSHFKLSKKGIGYLESRRVAQELFPEKTSAAAA